MNLFGPPLNATSPSFDPPTLSTLSLDDTSLPPSSESDSEVESAPSPYSATTADSTTAESASTTPAPVFDERFRFELLHLGVDRRLLLNRKKQLKMYRVWLQVRHETHCLRAPKAHPRMLPQGRWRKPLIAVEA